MMPKLLRLDPGEILTVLCANNAFPHSAEKEGHQQVESGIGVGREGKGGEATLRDFNPDLLLELAAQRFFGCLAWLDLAAGKLPETREPPPSCWSPRKQYAPVAIDEGADGGESEFNSGSRR